MTTPVPVELSPVTDLASLRAFWLNALGPFPQPVELQPEILSETDAGDHTRQLVRYTTELGARVEAFLLIPRDLQNPAPAAVVFHSTSANNIYQPVGLADDPTRHLGLCLVRRGYIVLAPRNYIFGYGENITFDNLTRERGSEDWRAATEKLLENHPGWTGMGKMLWDGMRAVDYLTTIPQVDRARIVAIGHSLGAKEALFLHAFDPRIAASIASEGGLAFAHSNWDSPWYFGEKTNGPAFAGHDLHEVIALGAPRPFMLIGGGRDDGPQSWPYIEAARPAYGSEAENLVLLLHEEGHTIPHKTRGKAFEWLEGKLK